MGRYFLESDGPFVWQDGPTGQTVRANEPDSTFTAKTLVVNQLDVMIANGVSPLISLEGPGGFITNGFLTVAGGGAIPAPPYTVGGFTVYMIGIRSDLGPGMPTVVIECTGVQPHILCTDGTARQLFAIRSDGAFAAILDTVNAVSFAIQAGAGIPVFINADALHMQNANGSSPYTAGDWAGAAPTTLQQAINRMSALLKTLNGGAPIP